MTDLFTILTLPQTSSAFTSFSNRSTIISVTADHSESASTTAPRKIARLDADSDSASASRSRSSAQEKRIQKGIIAIRVLGAPVKPLKESYDNADFSLVKRSISVLLTKGGDGILPGTYERIYAACRSAVCVFNKGEGIFDSLKVELERCVRSLTRSLLDDKRDDVEWLVPFVDACGWFTQQVGLLQSLLTYVDRVFIVMRKDLDNIKTLAYSFFVTQTLEAAAISQRLRSGIQQWVEWERKQRSGHVLRQHIPLLITHLRTFGKYEPIFESFYIKSTSEFYKAESTECYEAYKDNAKEFLAHCSLRRTEELQRAQELLPDTAAASVVQVTDIALLKGRLEWLADNAMGPLMSKKDVDGLSKMYMLFDRVEGLNILRATFKQCVQDTVKTIVIDVDKDDTMVQRLLDFKAFGDQLIATAFTSADPKAHDITARLPDQEFAYALIDAFQIGFKARRNKPAEMIAKAIDKAMRKGQKGKDDKAFKEELDAILGLYRFTDDKDVFRTFYHRALAKRLLLNKSASDAVETGMLTTLKKHYDPEFSMGDHMFKDLALSRELMPEYDTYCTRLDGSEYNQTLSVMVLQRSFWPFAAQKADVDLPLFMQYALSKYNTFYKNKHQGHKLDWDHSLGTASLRALFKEGDKELSVSLYQAIILLLFNESANLSFEDIKIQTRMEDPELRRTLQSLACGKKRVLRKQPLGKDVNDGDVFHFNADFTDPRHLVHINSIQSKETPEENKHTNVSIEWDRKHALDAAIVRVMKARKELHYEQLKTATIEAVKNHFVPDVATIKRRIQGLVEQEYLRRDEDDMNLYIYVA